MKSGTETTLCLVAAMLLVTAIVPVALAQDPGSEGQQTSRDRSDRPAPKPPASRTFGNSPAPTLEDLADESLRSRDVASEQTQFNNDLEYLKGVASYFARASQSADPDFKAIGSATAQVRLSMERLRSMLALPTSGTSTITKELELPTDRPQLKLLIHALSIQISDAARNPLLTSRQLDVTGSARTRADLDAIIELARRIRTQCELFGRDEQ